MDFDSIKDFIESVGDTVSVFGNEEAVREDQGDHR